MSDIRKGGCLCGAVRYEIDLTDHDTGHCHCTDCRKHTGAAFTMYTSVPKTQFKWLSAPTGIAKTSPEVERLFCKACGTPFTWENPEVKDSQTVLTLTLDDHMDIEPASEIFTKSRLPWMKPIEGVKQYIEED